MDESEHLEIKERAWERLSAIPGVHAVGLGTRVVAGNRTGEPAIVVFVVRKKSLDELDAAELVPSTFEGVKTDVVEMQVPRLLASMPPFTAVVNLLPATPGPPPQGSGGTITLIASSDPPAEGFVVVVGVTLTPLASGKPTFQVRQSVYTTGRLTLAQIAFKLMTNLTFSSIDRPLEASAPEGSPTVTIRASPTYAAAVSCFVLTMDAARYTDRHLRGGIRLQESQTLELGTLGCLATTAPTPDNPQGKVVAITCQHVVSTPRNESAMLRSVVNSASTEITIDKLLNIPIQSHTLVFVGFFKGLNLLADARYKTAPGDTLAAVVAGVITAINDASIPGVSASPHATDPNIVKVVGADAGGAYMQSAAFGPVVGDPVVTLAAVVLKASGVIVVTLSGRVSGPHYGIFLNVHPGGTLGSFGIFVNPGSQQTLTAIAADVAAAVNALPPAVRGTIRATPSAATITLLDAAAVECLIQRDVQVGHPTNNFACTPLGACTHRIGRVVDARLDVDAAIIELDPGLKYKPEIEGLGRVVGTLPPALQLAVQKRGFVSGVTAGAVTTLAVSGRIGGVSPRFYKNAFVVESTTKAAGETIVRPFLMAGDSGSVLVTAGAGPVKVVGLLFSSGDETTALAMPIDQVIDAFPALGLSFVPAPGQDPNAVQIVPKSASAFEAVAAPGLAVLGNRLAEAEEEITATSAGRRYAELVRRHFSEARDLVNNNRRVGTVWQRSGGPEILNAIVSMIYLRDQRLPTEIRGKPFTDCLARILRVLTRYASPAFSSDLARCAPRIAEWSGMTFPELLATLETAQAE